MILLAEGKRDELLLPYYELVKDKMPNLKIGQFKEIMLSKLGVQGAINNLSLGSNYYLAGATRYYFNGDLTTDHKASMLETGDVNTPDNWNYVACKKLNAVIEILRNAFIDTVGTQFEQPEDFGQLSFAKLIRKYNKKIMEILGDSLEDDGKDKEKDDGIDRNNRVGNGYTFEILYSYQQATKFNQYTVPGAWCITYGQGHYDYYRQHRGPAGIHYVIFMKDGFQNVERKKGPGFTSEKPHDEYGNSLIAFLQRNDTWQNDYITSRWNHGAGDSGRIEADHAYDLQEFCDITGVTPDDLKRIWTIWKADRAKYEVEDDYDVAVDKKLLKQDMINCVRKLKYAQMLINGGRTPEDVFDEFGLMYRRLNVKDSAAPQETPLKKCLAFVRVAGNSTSLNAVVDRGKIVFETIDKNVGRIEMFSDVVDNNQSTTAVAPGAVLLSADNYYLIYNSRYREMLTVDGVKKFKKIPKRWSHVNDATYFEVKNSNKDIALISCSDCRPLKLPNGRSWFNAIFLSYDYGWSRGNEIKCHFFGGFDSGSIGEILYDESSREKYFFNFKTKKFIQPLQGEKNTDVINNSNRHYWETIEYIQDPSNYELAVVPTRYVLRGLTVMAFTNILRTQDFYERCNDYDFTPYMLVKDDGTKLNIAGYDHFRGLQFRCGSLVTFLGNNDQKIHYDYINDTILAVGNDTNITYSAVHTNYNNTILGNEPFYFFSVGSTWDHKYKVYARSLGCFLKTPQGSDMWRIPDLPENDKISFYYEVRESQYRDPWMELYNMSEDERMELFGTKDFYKALAAERNSRCEMLVVDGDKIVVYDTDGVRMRDDASNTIPIPNYFAGKVVSTKNSPTIEVDLANQQQQEPATSLAESEIRSMVSEALRRIFNGRV